MQYECEKLKSVHDATLQKLELAQQSLAKTEF